MTHHITIFLTDGSRQIIKPSGLFKGSAESLAKDLFDSRVVSVSY